MAAESLENKAKEMGITLKAETNGSGGAKNVLTKEEIENKIATFTGGRAAEEVVFNQITGSSDKSSGRN